MVVVVDFAIFVLKFLVKFETFEHVRSLLLYEEFDYLDWREILFLMYS